MLLLAAWAKSFSINSTSVSFFVVVFNYVFLTPNIAASVHTTTKQSCNNDSIPEILGTTNASYSSIVFYSSSARQFSNQAYRRCLWEISVFVNKQGSIHSPLLNIHILSDQSRIGCWLPQKQSISTLQAHLSVLWITDIFDWKMTFLMHFYHSVQQQQVETSATRVRFHLGGRVRLQSQFSETAPRAASSHRPTPQLQTRRHCEPSWGDGPRWSGDQTPHERARGVHQGLDSTQRGDSQVLIHTELSETEL